MSRKIAGLVLGLSTRLVLAGVAGFLLGCHASKPKGGGAKAGGSAPAAEGSGVAGLSRTPDTAVINRYCNQPPGPAPEAISAMEDSAGYIGGYIFKRLILDSPVHYLDTKGDEVAMFHIFGPPEEKKRNTPIIDALRAAYPLEVPLECPPPAGK